MLDRLVPNLDRGSVTPCIVTICAIVFFIVCSAGGATGAPTVQTPHQGVQSDISESSIQNGSENVGSRRVSHYGGYHAQLNADGSSPPVRIANVKFTRVSGAINEGGRRDWIVGDTVRFRIIVTPLTDREYHGNVTGNITFVDSNEKSSQGVQVAWGEEARDLYAVSFDQKVDLYSGDDQYIIEKEVQIGSTFDQMVKTDGQSGTLTLTDLVRVSAGSDVNVIDNIRIRSSTTQLANVGLTLAAAYTGYTSGSVKQAVAPGKEDVLVMGAEQAVNLRRARIALVEGHYDTYETELENLFLNRGFQKSTADTLAKQLKSASIAGKKGKLLATSMYVVKSLYTMHTDAEVDQLYQRLYLVADYMYSTIIGTFEGGANIWDLLGTATESSETLIQPHEMDPEYGTESDQEDVFNRPYVDSVFHRLSGTVYKRSGGPLPSATIKIYDKDPRRWSPIDPVLTVSSDESGRFKKENVSIEADVLWYRVYKDGQKLTDTPRTRIHKDGFRALGVDGQYEIFVDQGDDDPKPQLNTTIEKRVTSDDQVEIKVTLKVTDGQADVTEWNSAGGVHLRIKNGTFTNVSKGSFDHQYSADRFNSSAKNNIKIIELYTNKAISSGESLSTGWIKVQSDEKDVQSVLSYRGWVYDVDSPRTIDGESHPYIARDPSGATYNRHVAQPTFTYLNYPVNVANISSTEDKIDGENISAFEVSTPSTNRLQVQITSGSPLSTLKAKVIDSSGKTVTTLTRSDFIESGSDPYTYTWSRDLIDGTYSVMLLNPDVDTSEIKTKKITDVGDPVVTGCSDIGVRIESFVFPTRDRLELNLLTTRMDDPRSYKFSIDLFTHEDSNTFIFTRSNNTEDYNITIHQKDVAVDLEKIRKIRYQPYGCRDFYSSRTFDPLTAPQATYNFTPTNPSIGETIVFNASNSMDLDGTIHSYKWDFNGDGTIDQTGPIVSHSYSKEDYYSPQLTVTDDRGVPNTYQQTIVVDRPIVTGCSGIGVRINDYRYVAKNQLKLDLLTTRMDDRKRYRMSVKLSTTTKSDTYVFVQDGSNGDYTERVHQDNVTVDLLNVTELRFQAYECSKFYSTRSVNPPTFPTARLTFTPATLTVGESIHFDASNSSDPDGSIQTYNWDFDGDGQYEKSGVSSVYTYSHEGDRTVSLQVVDDGGNTATHSVNVTVTSRNGGEGRLIGEPVGKFENPPTDTDNNGRFEDINGDRKLDLADVQAMFENRDGSVIRGHPDKFDFNNNSEVNIVDIQALYVKAVGDSDAES